MPLVTDTGWTAELTELLREFFPGGDDVEVRHTRRDTEPKNIFTIEGKTYPFVSVFPDARLNMAKRNTKLGLYDALSASTGRSLPWGTLTGIRPTKIPMTKLEEGWSREEIAELYAILQRAEEGRHD